MCWVLSRMRTNTQFASKLPLHPWSWPMCPWQHLHVGSACSIKDISHLKQPRLITEASLFLPNSKPTLNTPRKTSGKEHKKKLAYFNSTYRDTPHATTGEASSWGDGCGLD
ncbi:hypothetical protein MRX96_006091 [Rhipicephalus microplus]